MRFITLYSLNMGALVTLNVAHIAALEADGHKCRIVLADGRWHMVSAERQVVLDRIAMLDDAFQHSFVVAPDPLGTPAGEAFPSLS
jgi:hypothetical protein